MTLYNFPGYDDEPRTAESALQEWIDTEELILSEDETEALYQFTLHTESAEFNIRAIQQGADYAGIDLTHSPLPVPVVQWVSVAFMQDNDYYEAMDAINDMGGSVTAAIEYLAQWDTGDEADQADTRDSAPWGACDTTHTETVGGIEYTYATNHNAGYVSLNRHPLESD